MKQAQKVASILWLSAGSSGGVRLFSSPKRRCVETLIPFSQMNGTEIEPLEALDEGPPFEQKAAALKRLVDRTPGTLVFCSHGDVLPELVRRWSGEVLEFKKAECINLDRSKIKTPERN